MLDVVVIEMRIRPRQRRQHQPRSSGRRGAACSAAGALIIAAAGLVTLSSSTSLVVGLLPVTVEALSVSLSTTTLGRGRIGGHPTVRVAAASSSSVSSSRQQQSSILPSYTALYFSTSSASADDSSEEERRPSSSSFSSSSSNNNNNETLSSSSTITTTAATASSPLFVEADASDSKSNSNEDDGDTPQFGDVVSLKRPTARSANNNNNDDVVSGKSSSASFFSTPSSSSKVSPTSDEHNSSSSSTTSQASSSTPKPKTTTTSSSSTSDAILIQQRQRRNLGVALLSVTLAVLNYFWQWTHPLTPIQLLVGLQQSSTPLYDIGRNHKPTVIDFWAPWCENCKRMAPTLYAVEELYRDQVNFVMVNGDDPQNWPLIERLGVDAIPHLALIEADGTVDTALIGPVPKEWLTSDLDVLIENAKRNSAGWSEDCTDSTTATNRNNNNNNDGGGMAASVAMSSSTTQLCAATTETAAATKKQPLPYQMLDVFANRPVQDRRIAANSFDNNMNNENR